MAEKTTAIVLAGGRGTRMKSDVAKQFIEIAGKPLIYYSLAAFEKSFIQEVILVCGEEYIEYCQKEIIEKYGFQKVTAIVKGGKERYESVYNGLKAVKNADYVFIHDGARPCIDNELLSRGLECVRANKACVAAMPVKDTIKVVEGNVIVSTPARSTLYTIQTPQIFEYELVQKSYDALFEEKRFENITDDAMVVENYSDAKVVVYEGSYSNLKVTTPEDLDMVSDKLK